MTNAELTSLASRLLEQVHMICDADVHNRAAMLALPLVEPQKSAQSFAGGSDEQFWYSLVVLAINARDYRLQDFQHREDRALLKRQSRDIRQTYMAN